MAMPDPVPPPPQLWLYQGVVEPWSPPGGTPEAEEQPSAVEEVGPPPGKEPPPGTPLSAPPSAPPSGPSPASSFEYTLFDPGSALLCPRGHPQIAPPHDPPGGPYANLAPPHKGSPPPRRGPPKKPPTTGDPHGSFRAMGTPPGPSWRWGPPQCPPPTCCALNGWGGGERGAEGGVGDTPRDGVTPNGGDTAT